MIHFYPNHIVFAALISTICLGPQIANAKIKTCIRVEAEKEGDQKSFEKLVTSEILKHTSREIVQQNCTSEIFVETFTVDQKRFLTVRSNKQVPVRYTIHSPGELTVKLKEAMRLVLRSDPEYLKENITEYSSAQKALNSVTIRGTNIFRLELFQGFTRTGDGPSFTPGVAFALTRGSGHWRIFARIDVLFSLPAEPSSAPALKLGVGLDLGATYEFSLLKNASPYISMGAGLLFQRFEGLYQDADAILNCIRPQILGRFGVRVFRYADFDLDLFVAGYLPLAPASQTDSMLFGPEGKRYTPSVQLGIGVGF